MWRRPIFNLAAIAAARNPAIGTKIERSSRRKCPRPAAQRQTPARNNTMTDSGVLIRKANGKKYHQPLMLYWPAMNPARCSAFAWVRKNPWRYTFGSKWCSSAQLTTRAKTGARGCIIGSAQEFIFHVADADGRKRN